MPLLGQEPALGIPKCLAREAIKSWTEYQHFSTWKVIPGCRHDKLFIGRPYKKRADDLLKLGRHQPKMAVAILTGHAPANGHLRIMGLFKGDPSCKFCKMKTETVQHITCCCEALAHQRYIISGKPFVETKYKHSLTRGPLSLYKRHRDTESVLNDSLGLHNKPQGWGASGT